MNPEDVKPRNGNEISPDRISSLRLCVENEWLLWQLVDSAFPTGGFAHSAGLEAAWQHGEVKNRKELISFTESSLHQLGHAALPFAMASHKEPERVEEFDRLCDSFTSNHVANRASRAQGKAFLLAVQRIFAEGREMPLPPFNHFPCVFGAALSAIGVPRETTARMFFFNHLRGVIAAAVRLNIIGPMEGQTIQHRLSATAEDVLARCSSLALDEIAQTSPLLDLWQCAQDRLYSRLFQS
jgi:urease accessory protein